MNARSNGPKGGESTPSVPPDEAARVPRPITGEHTGSPHPAGGGGGALVGAGGEVVGGGLQPSPPTGPQDGPTAVPQGGTPQPKRS
jgi:hypothetical protein